MSSAAVRQIIFEHFEKDGTADRLRSEGQEKGIEKKARETALEMLGDGFAPEQVARYVKMSIEWVKGLTE